MISSEITLLINLKNTFIFPSAIPLRNPSSFWDFFWHCFRKIVKYNIFQTIHLRISSVLTLKFSLKNVYVLADILAATHFFLEIDLDISFKNSVFFSKSCDNSYKNSIDNLFCQEKSQKLQVLF